MADNTQPSIDIESDDYWDLSSSPFFADIDPSTSASPIGFSIPRPHRPPMDLKYTRKMLEYLKKQIALEESIQTIR